MHCACMNGDGGGGNTGWVRHTPHPTYRPTTLPPADRLHDSTAACTVHVCMVTVGPATHCTTPTHHNNNTPPHPTTQYPTPQERKEYGDAFIAYVLAPHRNTHHTPHQHTPHPTTTHHTPHHTHNTPLTRIAWLYPSLKTLSAIGTLISSSSTWLYALCMYEW